MVVRNELVQRRRIGLCGRLQIPVILVCTLFASLLWAGEEDARHTSLFNADWLKTLVSVEVAEPNKEPKSIGSAFLVETAGKHLAMITAKHVVFDKKGQQHANLAYRLNRKEGASDLITEAAVNQHSPHGWFKSSMQDVACRLMIHKGRDSDIKFIRYSHFLTEPGIEPGAPLFIIGFPMGLRSEEYAMPILRSGMVARAAPDKILAEAFVFPGNSGGPVVYAPTDITMFLSSMLHGQWLVGLVSNSVHYVDVAVSPQTGRPRITFEENSGLCSVVPASAILELLESPEFVAVDMAAAGDQSDQEREGEKGQEEGAGGDRED